MANRSWLFFLLLCMLTSTAFAQRPPSGTDVDERRMVSLLQTAPSSCIAVPLSGASVVLDRAALEQQVATSPREWKTEAERLALIAGKRAAALLAGLDETRTVLGCATSAKAISADAMHLLLQYLEAGQALVLDLASGQPVPAVEVHYFGKRCGQLCGRGDISVSLSGTKQTIMVVSWWVS